MTWTFPNSFCWFFRRHRNKFIFTGVFVGGLIGAVKFAEYKFKQHIKEEQNNAIASRRRQRTLEKVHMHSVSLTESMLKEIMDEVFKISDTEAITEMLKNSKDNKLKLWNELKVAVFTKTITGIISVVALVVVLRFQFVQLAASMSSDSDNGLSDELQQKFLAVSCNYLKDNGIKKLWKILYNKGITVTEGLPLQCLVTFKNIETTLLSMVSCSMSDNGTENNFILSDYCFPDECELDFHPQVCLNISKTLDLLQSPDCHRVFVNCVAKGIELVGRNLCDSILSASNVAPDAVKIPSIPLAKSIPLLNTQLSYICSRDFVENVAETSLLQKLSGVVTIATMSGLLKGVRVLDLTRILAGPYATMIFGDMGADVIKVESRAGDDTRAWGPPFIGGESVYFMSVNRNKRSIVVDIKQPKGLKVLHKLVSNSDILVENFLPGKLDAMGMGYNEVKKLNRGLVYCSITGFGADGPLASRAGYDVIASSMGGLINITGPGDGDPCKVGVAVTDICTGLLAHGAILAALRDKEITGLGQKIDCNLLSTQVSVLSHIAANYLNSGIEPRRWGTAHPTIVPYQAFKTKDGHFLTIGGGNNKQFKTICDITNLQELSNNPKFMDNKDRLANREELIKILSKVFQTKTRDEWLHLLEGSGIPYSPINNMKQTFENPQVLHNKMIMELEHDGINDKIRVPGSPVQYSKNHFGNNIKAPPLLGQHTREVLTEVGYTDGDVDQLILDRCVAE